MLLGKRALTFFVSAAAFGVNFFPSPQFRAFIERLAADSASNLVALPAGAWLAVQHLLLFSTLTAGACLVAWIALANGGLVDPVLESFAVKGGVKGILAWGLGGGVLFAALFLPLSLVVMPRTMYEVGPFLPSAWVVFGNLFSNLYEEIIYRGLMFNALARIMGARWPALLLSSVVFGAMHVQYPMSGQAMVAVMGLVMGCVYVKTKSLWGAWLSHMTVDVLFDVFVKFVG